MIKNHEKNGNFKFSVQNNSENCITAIIIDNN